MRYTAIYLFAYQGLATAYNIKLDYAFNADVFVVLSPH